MITQNGPKYKRSPDSGEALSGLYLFKLWVTDGSHKEP